VPRGSSEPVMRSWSFTQMSVVAFTPGNLHNWTIKNQYEHVFIGWGSIFGRSGTAIDTPSSAEKG
jgi:hypothetical protein